MALLILDRDGVINEDTDAYIRSPDEWFPIPGSIEAIAALSNAGYRVAVATNQSGLSRGFFTLDALEQTHAKLRELVETAGGHIEGVFYCPHLPEENCNCRKPRTGLLQVIEKTLGESAVGAYFIGDSLKDLQAATAHGCIPMLVKTGRGKETLAKLSAGPDSNNQGLTQLNHLQIYDSLLTASHAILKKR